MRLMGLDVGDKTVGIAISDPLMITAQGKETLFRESIKSDIDALIQWIVDYEVDKIVVGLPLNMNGTLGPQGEKTKQFIDKLEKKIKHSTRLTHSVEIVYWDERLTTASATRMLIDADVSRKKRKDVVDTVAAAIILQSYMDGQNMERKES